MLSTTKSGVGLHTCTAYLFSKNAQSSFSALSRGGLEYTAQWVTATALMGLPALQDAAI